MVWRVGFVCLLSLFALVVNKEATMADVWDDSGVVGAGGTLVLLDPLMMGK